MCHVANKEFVGNGFIGFLEKEERVPTRLLSGSVNLRDAAMWFSSSLVATLIVLFGFTKADYDLSDEECRELGYNRETLKCQTCSLFVKYELEELLSDCRACCTAEDTSSTSTHEKYASADIEICECNLARFPQVQAFVKSSMVNQWGSNVKVRHVRGVLPTIVLKSYSGESKRFNIEKWDTDTITDFLNSWLDY
uniref:Selenoprotein F n=1 Tax=Steinernema glaseri TaxID=37863 RepID=A0A1I7ZDX5_9BILA